MGVGRRLLVLCPRETRSSRTLAAKAALDRLPARTRQVLFLRRVEGLTYREIAARFGMGTDDVERHIASAVWAVAAGMSEADQRRAADGGHVPAQFRTQSGRR